MPNPRHFFTEYVPVGIFAYQVGYYLAALWALDAISAAAVGNVAVLPALIAFRPIARVDVSPSTSAIPAGAFENNPDVQLVSLPGTVTSIGDGAFGGCPNLRTVKLASGTTSIGAKAFAGCTSLKKVLLPSSIWTIGPYAFRDCSALRHISLPNGLLRLAEGTFLNAGLTELEIPESIEAIEEQALSCTSLGSCVVPPTVRSLDPLAFSSETLVEMPDELAASVANERVRRQEAARMAATAQHQRRVESARFVLSYEWSSGGAARFTLHSTRGGADPESLLRASRLIDATTGRSYSVQRAETEFAQFSQETADDDREELLYYKFYLRDDPELGDAKTFVVE